MLLAAVATSAQTQTTGAGSFENHCANCHGADGTGSDRVPSILAFIRYHTDAELVEVLEMGRTGKGMPAFQLVAPERSSLVAHLRSLSGSPTAMATGGFTGEGLKANGGRRNSSGPRPGSLQVQSADHAPVILEGSILSEGEYSAQVLTNDGRVHLLSRDGTDAWTEKSIEPKSNWEGYNGGNTGNRYSELNRLNSANVHNLALAWLFPVPGSPRLEATPVVVDGVLYVTGWNELYALDSTTGQQIWMYRQPRTEGILSNAGKGANRGVAVSGDNVFMVTDNAHLLALNRKTGKKLWDVTMGDFHEGYSATGAPLVAGDMVVSGVAGGEEGARGFVDAYKIETGEHLWRFYTIPKRGEKGSETWAGNALEHGCGATWLTGSWDPALGLIYWQTGNPCPDYNGDERKGDNLYTSSVVALSAKTGELKWHYQFTPHDVHDWDATEPLILVDQPWKGVSRKLILHGNRNGFFFVLDRTNGDLLLAEPFAKVNWVTGYGKDGRPVLTKNFDSSKEGTLTCPASNGGANWPASSWSPLTKLFYVRASDWCGIYKKQDDPLVENRWFGGVAPNQPGAENFIRALDINTGKKIWEYPLGGAGRAGMLSAAGNLLFFGSSQGSFVAVDARDGKPLWRADLGQNWQASPMTWMIGGRQYVAMAGPSGVFAFSLPQ